MPTIGDDHRGHAIFTHASGPGPFVASSSTWKIEPNNSYLAVLQGTLPGVFSTADEAHGAAMADARNRLDELLDSP